MLYYLLPTFLLLHRMANTVVVAVGLVFKHRFFVWVGQCYGTRKARSAFMLPDKLGVISLTLSVTVNDRRDLKSHEAEMK